MPRELTPIQLLVLMALRNSRPEQRYAYAIHQQIQQGIAPQPISESTVRTILGRLAELGLIVVDPATSAGDQRGHRKFYAIADQAHVGQLLQRELELHEQAIAQTMAKLRQLHNIARQYLVVATAPHS